MEWREVLMEEWDAPYMVALRERIKELDESEKEIYPPELERFNALQLTPFDSVRVVILGQDPYHGPGQANGLAFSVLKGVTVPPSLKNIYKELELDVGVPVKGLHGDLTTWAEQGVLLLNSVLTVERGHPMSHHNMGWESFTDKMVSELNLRRENLVFMLWGKQAQKKGEHINPKRHNILTAAHPSPYSADKGFFGCKHFSLANKWLMEHDEDPIRWRSIADDNAV